MQRARDNERDDPGEGAGGLPRPWVDISFRLDVEEYELMKNGFGKTREEMMARPGFEGLPPDSKEILLHLCRRGLETDPGNLPKDRVEKGGSAYTILYKVCPGCRTAWIQTEKGPVEVPIEHVEAIEAEAKKVTIRPEEETASPPREPPAIDPPNSPALTEKVLHRDGLVCAVPGCGRKIGLQADHIQERAEGGRTELANEHGLCARHHGLKTAGLLKVYRGEDGKLVYERKADNLTAAILAEAEREVAAMPRVVVVESRRLDSGNGPVPGGSGRPERWAQVLDGVGHGKEEARRRIEWAIEAIRRSGRMVTEEDVLRLACAWGYDRRQA